jgi:hypothetical protein
MVSPGHQTSSRLTIYEAVILVTLLISLGGVRQERKRRESWEKREVWTEFLS